MPYCHRCRAEYVDSVSICPECGEPLSPQPPPPAGNPDIKLVVVYLAQGEIDAQVVRSLLEANGIDCSLSGESVRLTHGLTVDGLAQVKILVREDDEVRARETISSSDYLRDCPVCGEANPAEVSACRYCGKPIGTATS